MAGRCRGSKELPPSSVLSPALSLSAAIRQKNYHPLTGKPISKPLSPVLQMLKKLDLPSMNALTEKDVARAKEAFMEVDQDGSGFLEMEELVYTLKKLGHDVSAARMKEMVRPYDLNGDGRLDLREFIAMLASNSQDIHGMTRDQLCTDALIERLGVPEDDGPTAAGGAQGQGSAANAPSDRLAAEKLEELERRLRTDFDLSVHLADHIPPPITEEKLRLFLCDTPAAGALRA